MIPVSGYLMDLGRDHDSSSAVFEHTIHCYQQKKHLTVEGI